MLELVAAAPVTLPSKPRTQWETVATTRWGRYTTGVVERAGIQHAAWKPHDDSDEHTDDDRVGFHGYGALLAASS